MATEMKYVIGAHTDYPAFKGVPLKMNIESRGVLHLARSEDVPSLVSHPLITVSKIFIRQKNIDL